VADEADEPQRAEGIARQQRQDDQERREEVAPRGLPPVEADHARRDGDEDGENVVEDGVGPGADRSMRRHGLLPS